MIGTPGAQFLGARDWAILRAELAAVRKANGDVANVTLKEVADFLNLHPATVSVVLNNTPGRAVPLRTRERIKDAARKLGYVPNALARSLRTGKTYNIGVVLPELTNVQYAAILNGIGNRLTQSDYSYVALHHGHDPAKARHCISMLESRGVEGLIVLDATLNRPVKVPAIAIGCQGAIEGMATLIFDRYRAAALAMYYSRSLGQAKILMIRGAADAQEDGLASAVLEASALFCFEVVEEVFGVADLPGEFSASRTWNRIEQTIRSSRQMILTFDIHTAKSIASFLRQVASSFVDSWPILCIDRLGSSQAGMGVAVIRQHSNAVGRISADAIIQWAVSGENFAGRVLTGEPELVGPDLKKMDEICHGYQLWSE